MHILPARCNSPRDRPRRANRLKSQEELAIMRRKLFNFWVVAIFALAPLASLGARGVGDTQNGVASYYSDRFDGRRTASGERYDRTAYTAAHKRLPLGTVVRVTNTRNGKSVDVTINDRGPYVKGRIIDLSRRAAWAIGMAQRHLTKVEVEVLSLPGRAHDG
jgi:rare lipoprotein A